jgi:hypothetical protein
MAPDQRHSVHRSSERLNLKAFNALIVGRPRIAVLKQSNPPGETFVISAARKHRKPWVGYTSIILTLQAAF